MLNGRRPGTAAPDSLLCGFGAKHRGLTAMNGPRAVRGFPRTSIGHPHDVPVLANQVNTCNRLRWAG